MYSVYILYSEARKIYYIGATNNLDKRLKEHNNGNSRFTKSGKPWRLMYKEECETMQMAREKEKFFKSGKGRELRDKLLPQ